MGDFVHRMEREDVEPVDEGFLPLLDLDAPPSKSKKDRASHEPITDFALHVAAELQSVEILKGWPPAEAA